MCAGPCTKVRSNGIYPQGDRVRRVVIIAKKKKSWGVKFNKVPLIMMHADENLHVAVSKHRDRL